MRRMRVYSCLVLGLSLLVPVGAVADEELFIGLDFSGSTLHVDSPHVPPDSMGAVGPDHIVELINGRYSVYSKADGGRVRTSTLNDFWIDAGIAVRNVAFDPRILYDPRSERWFAAAAHDARADGALLVAVSLSSDPTEGWAAFEVDPSYSPDCWADFPTLGMNDEGIFVAAHILPSNPYGRCSGVVLLVVPKEDLLAGARLTPVVTTRGFVDDGSEEDGDDVGPAAEAWASVPENLLPELDQSTRVPSVDDDTPVNEVRVAIVHGLRSWQSVQPIVDLDARGIPPVILTVDRSSNIRQFERWAIVGDVVSPWGVRRAARIPVEGYGARYFGRQPEPKAGVEIIQYHLGSNVVLRNGSLWGVHTAGEYYDLDTGLRWFRIDPETNEVLQEGFIDREGMDYYYPSIAVNEYGDVVIGFNGSGPTDFVGSYAVLGRTTDGVTTFGEPLLLQPGLAGYEVIRRENRNRWGDYSATVVDPTNPHVFWTFQEYVSAEDVWSTRITQLVAVPERFVGRFKPLEK